MEVCWILHTLFECRKSSIGVNELGGPETRMFHGQVVFINHVGMDGLNCGRSRDGGRRAGETFEINGIHGCDGDSSSPIAATRYIICLNLAAI